MAGQHANWIIGIATVVFDVDIGQKVNNMVPESVLSKEEQRALAFHAFPDSMSMELHSRSSVRDSSFFFRLRRQAAGQQADDAQVAGEPAFLYGFVFCRQRQDETLRRGGEQNSVVVLSEQPFSSALVPLSQIAGPLYFNQGAAALQQVYLEVQAWPAPVPGVLQQLPVAMSTIPARLPAFRTFPPPAPEVDPAALASAASCHLHRRSSAVSVGGGARPGEGGASRSPHSSMLSLAAPPSEGRSASDDAASAAAAAAVTATAVSGDAGMALGTPVVQLLPNTYTLRERQLETSPLQMRQRSLELAAPGSPLHGSADNIQGAAEDSSMHGARHTIALKRSASAEGPGPQPKEELAGAFSEVDVYTPLAEQLPRLWQLWEMVLTCQQLLVVAPSPGDASSCVAALISLLAPLPFAADFRPYYTIHDPAFRHLAAGELPTPSATSLPCLLGVTNLFFVRALQQWPNVLAVGRKEAAGGHWGAGGGGGAGAVGSLLNPSNAVKALKRRQQGALQLMSEHTQALWAAYKPLCRPDQLLLSRLVQPRPGDGKAKLQRAALVNSTAIRRHFADLTAAFLAPFAPYLEPSPAGHAASGARLPRWDAGAFLFSVHTRSHEPALLGALGGSRPALAALYERFIRSVNFSSWFEGRRRPLEHLVEKEPPPGMDAFSSAVRHMDEVQLLQAFFSLELQLQEAMSAASDAAASATTVTPATIKTTALDSSTSSTSTSSSAAAVGHQQQQEALALQLQRLRRQASAVFCALPEDLQQTLVSSPTRRALLRSLHLDGSLDPVLAQLVARLQADGEELIAAAAGATPGKGQA